MKNFQLPTLLLLILHLLKAQVQIQPINNTVGIYFNVLSQMKISNNKWTLLVYKDIKPIRNALDNNNKILETMEDMLTKDSPRIKILYSQIKTHTILLNQISRDLEIKYLEIFADTERSRYKRGLINAIGDVWKFISGSLNAEDGEFYSKCIEKLNKDEHELQNLIKNQISVTTSVIKNFNTTIQNLQLDEKTFNDNLKKIETSILNISDGMAFFQAQLELLELCERLLESYTFLENSINDILNAITFARLKIIHTSIITPRDLINSLNDISQVLTKDNLPITPTFSNIAKYLEIIELHAFQKDSKIIFVLKIPLVESETYTLFEIFPLPTQDNRTGLHHVVVTSQKYIARDDDSMLYVTFSNIEKCKKLEFSTQLCEETLPLPIDNNAICEAQLLKQQMKMPKTCQTSIILAEDYNVKEIDKNQWLVTISEPLPITTKCTGKEPVSSMIKRNSIVKLQPECSAYIGSTRIRSKFKINTYNNVTHQIVPVLIPFDCCTHLPEKINLPKLKPLKLSKIDTEELNIAQHNLDKYSDELDKLINEPFIEKNISWFTYFIITIIIIVIIWYIFCKCKKRRGLLCITGPNDPRPPYSPLKTNFRFRNLLPRRRPSVNPDIDEEIELN